MLSWLRADRTTPSSRELEFLAQYGRLVGRLGAEALSAGVDERCPPAGRNVLRDIIACTANRTLPMLVLRADDLPRLYGARSFFLNERALALVREGRVIAGAHGARRAGVRGGDAGLHLAGRLMGACVDERDAQFRAHQRQLLRAVVRAVR